MGTKHIPHNGANEVARLGPTRQVVPGIRMMWMSPLFRSGHPGAGIYTVYIIHNMYEYMYNHIYIDIIPSGNLT